MTAESCASFLDNAVRVADMKYIPSTGSYSRARSELFRDNTGVLDDILRARLRTVGVEEYRMTLESGTSSHVYLTFPL